MKMKDYGFYRGVNLGGWLSQCDYSRERMDHFITEKDIENDAAKLALAAVHHLSFAPNGSMKIGVYPAKVSGLTRFLIMGQDGD